MRRLSLNNQVSLLPQLLLLTTAVPIFQQMPAAAAAAVAVKIDNRGTKTTPKRGNVTPSTSSLSSAAVGAKSKSHLPAGGDEVSVETAPDEDEIEDEGKPEPTKSIHLKPTTRTETKPSKSAGGGGGSSGGRKRPNQAVESAKSAIIREFVASHGERIRKSRKHADLFDGSGYLIDMIKELNQYESLAEEEEIQSRRRHKRSTSAADGDNNSEQDLPNFASLSEALAHLNGGHQKETISADFNVRFVDDDNAELQQEAGDEPAWESKRQLRRRKRSLGNPDDHQEEEQEVDSDDPDWWLRDGGDRFQDNAETEAEEESQRQREAAESMERLDADLKELAKYLDEQAAEEQLLLQEEQLKPLGNFNRGISAAYKNLVKLRRMAVDELSSSGSADAGPQQPLPSQQQERMRDLYPDKTANWHIDAEVLEATLGDLKKYYRQIDEL